MYVQNHTYITNHLEINECSDENGGCSQICTNTAGSFYCGCYTGFELKSDGVNCIGEYHIKHTYKETYYVCTNACTPYVLRILKHVLYLCIHLYNY